MRLKPVFVFTIILLILAARPVMAHKVIIFAWVEDGMIFTESSFGSKRKAMGCKIIAADESGQLVHTGLTDKSGKYAFKVPENMNSDLILTLEAGTGHKALWRLSKAEFFTKPSAVDKKAAMQTKEKLEQEPPIIKILGGIFMIFILAFIIKRIKRKAS